MAVKMILVGADGGVPKESEGMAELLGFLYDIVDKRSDIISVVWTSNEVYNIYPDSLSAVSYDPRTGEISRQIKDGLTLDKGIPSCLTDTVCHMGCGCGCWVDLGWRPTVPVRGTNYETVHCKDVVE